MDKKDLCANRVCIGSLVALKVRLYSSVVFSHDNINQPNLPKILLISNLFTSAKLWAEAWGMKCVRGKGGGAGSELRQTATSTHRLCNTVGQ